MCTGTFSATMPPQRSFATCRCDRLAATWPQVSPTVWWRSRSVSGGMNRLDRFRATPWQRHEVEFGLKKAVDRVLSFVLWVPTCVVLRGSPGQEYNPLCGGSLSTRNHRSVPFSHSFAAKTSSWQSESFAMRHFGRKHFVISPIPRSSPQPAVTRAEPA